MKPFIKKFLIFLVPLLVCLIYIETYLQFYPSIFQLKAKFINANKDKVSVLILGSSHNQESVNPEYFTKEVVTNQAFGGQDLVLDSRMLNKFIPGLPKLKYVFLELGYHSLEFGDSFDNERNNLYLRYYGINNFGRLVNPLDYSIFIPHPKLYMEFLNPFLEKTAVNKYGFATELSRFERGIQRFPNLNYDSAEINKDRNNLFITRHQYEDVKAYEKNKQIFEGMVATCVKNKITPVILLTPVYKTYFEEMLPAKNQRRKELIKYLIDKYPSTVLLNYENTGEFKITDFTNDDHLNPEGAKLFTLKLDSILNQKAALSANH